MLGWKFYAQIWHFQPTPYKPAAISNIPGRSFLKEMLENNYLVKHLMSKWKIGNCQQGIERLTRSLSPMNLHLLSQKLTASKTDWVRVYFHRLLTLYFLERVASKICIHFSQFSETTELCCKNISIMPALCLHYAPDIVLRSKLCRHNPTDPSGKLKY